MNARDRSNRGRVARRLVFHGQVEPAILTFTVSDRDPMIAARLATAYAQEYARYRLQIDTAALETARRQIQERIGESSSDRIRPSALSTRASWRESSSSGRWKALQTVNASVARTPQGARRYRRTRRVTASSASWSASCSGSASHSSGRRSTRALARRTRSASGSLGCHCSPDSRGRRRALRRTASS